MTALCNHARVALPAAAEPVSQRGRVWSVLSSLFRHCGAVSAALPAAGCRQSATRRIRPEQVGNKNCDNHCPVCAQSSSVAGFAQRLFWLDVADDVAMQCRRCDRLLMRESLWWATFCLVRCSLKEGVVATGRHTRINFFGRRSELSAQIAQANHSSREFRRQQDRFSFR